MKKLILPILCGIFALFFSGKPASKNNCGPFLVIDNISGGAGTIGVTQVVIQNHTWGTTTTYLSPTFPFNHNELNGTISVTYYFNGSYTGCSVFSPPCDVSAFTNQTQVSVLFDAPDCDIYNIKIHSRQPSWPCFSCM